MAIKKPIPITFALDSHQSVQSVCAVIHIDDKNTETLDLSLLQGGEHIAVSPNSTVTARFVRVKDKILISDNVPCAVQGNGNIYIPIDNAAAHMLVGEIKIEVNIVNKNDILTMQFPLVIRVNNTILADAETSPESGGTIPELLEEAREAAEDAAQAAEAATEAISTKQDKLTAGENITIEGNVISAEGGVTDYNELENKPQINGVELTGNKTSAELDLQAPILVVNAQSSYDDNPYLEKQNDSIMFNSQFLFTGQSSYEGLPKKSYWGSVFGYCCIFTQRDLSSYTIGMDKEIPTNEFGTYFRFNSGDNLARFNYYLTVNGTLYLQKVTMEGGNWSVSNWEKLSGGGAQIVSGVVNANGTITFTDSEGNTFTTSGESVIGADGFSPSATVQQTASGATITVTDKNGTTTANISNGAPGQDYVLTAQDKTDIANIVLSELPTTEGVLYGN